MFSVYFLWFAVGLQRSVCAYGGLVKVTLSTKNCQIFEKHIFQICDFSVCTMLRNNVYGLTKTCQSLYLVLDKKEMEIKLT